MAASKPCSQPRRTPPLPAIMLAAAERLRSVATALQADIDAVRGSAALAGLGAELTPDAGYEIQRHCQAIRVARGESPVGYKVGCTSARVQKAFGIPGPIYGRLWAGEQLQSAVAGAGVPLQVVLANFVGLAIEGELAVEIVEAPPDAPPAEWLVDYFPVIELHHCEFDCDAAVRAGEFIAKNGIHAGARHRRDRNASVSPPRPAPPRLFWARSAPAPDGICIYTVVMFPQA
jgi:2-keto-4-pentenoate hydratase